MDFSPAAYDLLVGLKATNEPKLGLAGEFESVADWGTRSRARPSASPGFCTWPTTPSIPMRPPPGHRRGSDAPGPAYQRLPLHPRPDRLRHDGADPVAGQARYILAWIRRTGASSFTLRDAYQALRAGFKAPAEMVPPLDLLAEHDVIRCRPEPPRSRPGRPPSPVFDVNPRLHTHNARNTHNSVLGASARNSVNSVQDFGAAEPAAASARKDDDDA